MKQESTVSHTKTQKLENKNEYMNLDKYGYLYSKRRMPLATLMPIKMNMKKRKNNGR